MYTEFWSENLNHLEDPDIDWRMIVKQGGKSWTELIQARTRCG